MMFDEIKSAFSENKIAIISSIAILFISLILGYLLQPHLYDYLNPVVDDLTEKVQTGVITLTFQSIFFNNIQIVFSMFVYGLIFCFSALILGFNGFFTGYYLATSDNIVSPLLLIIHHGIFEFSSCILACASGFVLFNFLAKFILTLLKQKDSSIKESLSVSYDASYPKLKQAFIIFIIASVLMAIAGFVEAYLTLPIAEFLYPFFS